MIGGLLNAEVLLKSAIRKALEDALDDALNETLFEALHESALGETLQEALHEVLHTALYDALYDALCLSRFVEEGSSACLGRKDSLFRLLKGTFFGLEKFFRFRFFPSSNPGQASADSRSEQDFSSKTGAFEPDNRLSKTFWLTLGLL